MSEESAKDPRASGRSRPRGGAVVDAVLTSTLEELATTGLSRFSVDGVARRAKVNKTTIYRRWPTREALIVAALERVLDGVGDTAAALPDSGEVRTDLLSILRPLAALLSVEIGRMTLRAALSQDAAGGTAALATRRLAAQAGSPLQAIAERARRRGQWRDDVDPDQLVFALVGACMHRALLEQAPLDEQWLEALVDLVLRGVEPRSGPS